MQENSIIGMLPSRMKPKDMKLISICVLGAGSWGTALASLLTQKGFDVVLWAYEKDVAFEINKAHKNSTYLKGISLPKKLGATTSFKDAVRGRNVVVSVIPSHVLRKTLLKCKDSISKDALIVSCTKGIETDTGKLASDILKETLGLPRSNLTYLSGPSFAVEVAKGLPTTVVIAGEDPEKTKIVQEIFRTDKFLTFTHPDVIGVELGGALKNVIAIATGISDGLGFGSNSRAALITRGLYEMIKIGKTLGANPMTFAGLTGMGDLILTATSTKSRNYSFGFRIGKGEKASDILKGMKMVAEGYKTSKAVHNLIGRHNIYAPVCEEIYKMLYKGKPARRAATDLFKIKLGDELRKILT